MILDELTTFSDAQAVTAAADSTNTIVIGENGVATYPLYAVFQCVTDFGGAQEFQILGSDTEAGTYTTVVTSGSRAAATLKAGTAIVLPLPPECPKYIKARYNAAGAGTVNAFLAFNPQTNVEANLHEAV